MKTIKKFKTSILFLAFILITAGFIFKPVGPELGSKAPELAYKNPDGKEMKLSSLKGKMVLIDFWASWCGPCRKENPNVVRVYQKYKDEKFTVGKGFTVFNYSLDKDLNKWKTAIKQDQLDWKYHVSDLKGWKAEGASAYGVRSIPSNYLIDGEGNILAKNLRGEKLDMALDKYLKR